MRLAVVLLCLAVLACARADDGPERIAWDRDVCRGCSMAISDHHFAVEVRGGPKHKLEKFDDIGCAVKWLETQSWANDVSTRIWVADAVNTSWLDAHTASYAEGAKSPMGYGYAAASTVGGLTFDELKRRLTTARAKP